jgi:hypothetical protein
MKRANVKLIFLFLLFNSCSIVHAQWVTHHDPVFQPNIPKPSVGMPITDPKFGTTLTRLSNARESGYAGIVPQYSKRQAWNVDESLMLLFTGDGRTLLYNGETYQFIKEINGVGGEDVFWHPTNPEIIIYAQDNALYSYNVKTETTTQIRSFDDYTFINTRGEGNLSRDGRYYAFVGQVYDTETHFRDIVVYDIVADSIISKLALPPTLTDFDWVSISPLGNYVVVDYATENTGRFEGVEVYDKKLNFIWQKPLGAGHSDLGTDEDGNEILVFHFYDSEANCYFIKKFRLSDGKETSLLELSWQFDLHISCRNEARPEWCFISTFDDESRLTDDSLSWLPFEDEIFALKLDGSGEVQRIAHHHSRRFSSTTPDRDHSVYWAEPHATISRKGERILFGSNWREKVEEDSSVDTYIVDFRSWVGVKDEDHQFLKEICLEQNYPNPFNPKTKISYSLAIPAQVQLTVCNMFGQQVALLDEGLKPAGNFSVDFNADNLPSGIYYYRLQCGNRQETRQMILIK